MALKTFLLRKKITDAKKQLDALKAKDAEFEQRRKDLEAAIEAAQTDEERSAVEEAVDAFDAEQAENEKAKGDLDQAVRDLEKELEEEESKQDTTPPPEATPPAEENERKDNKTMKILRRVFAKMSAQERADFVSREDVKQYLADFRTSIREKRAVNNVGLTIPEVMLGLLRQNIEGYSKLYKHVTARSVSGDGRMLVEGAIPEAVWTECCANINELSLGFNDVEVDCYKVAGYFKICNANLEDSDIDLAGEILDAIGQAIGLALDKAILYGRNSAANAKMPQGIVSRLVEQSIRALPVHGLICMSAT